MGDGHDEDDGHGDDEGRSADAAHVEATGEDAGRDAPMAADGAGLRREGRCGAGEDGLREAGMACTAPVGRCGRTVSVRAAGGRRAMAPRGASAPVRCPCGPLSGRRCAGASGAPLGRPSVGAIVAGGAGPRAVPWKARGRLGGVAARRRSGCSRIGTYVPSQVWRLSVVSQQAHSSNSRFLGGDFLQIP